MDSWCLHDNFTAENLCGLDTNLLLNNVQAILVKITIKLMLIFLSNSFFNSFMKMKKEKWTVFRFPFFYENEKRTGLLKIQSKALLNMKMVVKCLNFVFNIEIKTKSNYKILNFVFQFIKYTKWHFGYTDFYWALKFFVDNLLTYRNKRVTVIELRN